MSEPVHGDPQDQMADSTSAVVSKSARKRQMAALQKLGESLLDLPPGPLAELPLTEKLREALALAKTLKQGEGRRRQLQYIGKLMRTERTESIAAALAEREDQERLFRQRFQRLEQLRDNLLTAAGDLVLNEVLREHRELDAQQLRQLIRQGRKEAAEGRAPTAQRKLFRYLRDNLHDHPHGHPE